MTDLDPGPRQLAPSPVIEIRGLCKTFREGRERRPVLDRLDLDVAEGEILALLGRSGSGKSTLLNIISGIEAPDDGKIVVAGKAIHALSERERTLFRRREIGFVFQFFNLIPTLTVRENLLLPLALNGVEPGDRSAELLARIGLADRERSFPDLLSGGEQQRVAIARALAHEPSVLLADEPTGNLDSDTGEQILDLLLTTVREHRTSLIMVTHSRELAARADRILRLQGGRLEPVPK